MSKTNECGLCMSVIDCRTVQICWQLHQTLMNQHHLYWAHSSPKILNIRSLGIYICITFVSKLAFLPVPSNTLHFVTISVPVNLWGFSPDFFSILCLSISALNPSESVLPLFSLLSHYSPFRPHKFTATTFLPFKSSCNSWLSIYKPSFNPGPHKEPKCLDQLSFSGHTSVWDSQERRKDCKCCQWFLP